MASELELQYFNLNKVLLLLTHFSITVFGMPIDVSMTDLLLTIHNFQLTMETTTMDSHNQH